MEGLERGCSQRGTEALDNDAVFGPTYYNISKGPIASDDKI